MDTRFAEILSMQRLFPTRSGLLTALAGLIAVFGFVSSANAALTLKVDIAGFGAAAVSRTIIDNSADDKADADGDESNGIQSVDGLISFSYSSAALNLIMTLGSSKPFTSPNPGPIAIMSLDSLEYDSSGPAGTITITLSDNGFVLEPVTGFVGYEFENSGTLTNATATAGFSVDLENALFGSPDFSTSLLAMGTGSGGQVIPTPGNPFSMTMTQVISVGSGNSVGSVDTKVTLSVPEPASVLAWLVSMPALALATVLRRRSRQIG